ncbi:MAG TPA: FHA domain-containing protein [Chthonomonadales bacterium]|nr:FHA domain-containing protein [Chthonomonadales bacterium]
MRSRVLLGVLFGTVGGFLGFLLQETFVPHAADPDLPVPIADQLRLGMFVGAMLGLAIGTVEGVVVGSSRVFLRGALLGILIGAVGGVFGIYFGGIVFNLALFGKTLSQLTFSDRPTDFVHLAIARTLGFAFLGALPGLAAGAATLSQRRALHGLIGGLGGGLIGGMLFDPLGAVVGHAMGPAIAVSGQTMAEVGGPSRAIGFTVIGAMTGLFVGLVEELMKQASVRVLVGRNEGRDYILSKPLTVIGRDERADVPVFGDPALAPQHAAIRMEEGRHVLLHGGSPPASLVNGQPVVQRQLLRDADMIQIGQVRLLFREKATAARAGRQAIDAPMSDARGGVAMPTHLCPFCGAARDGAGRCLCSVAPGAMGVQVAPAARGSRLIGVEGPHAGQAFPIAAPVTTIGRDATQSVVLSGDATVSRRHARIVEEPEGHVIYDEGSSNGTMVNGMAVTVQPLSPGDIVALGATQLRYE